MSASRSAPVPDDDALSRTAVPAAAAGGQAEGAGQTPQSSETGLRTAASERDYRLLFEVIDEGFCVVEMIFDAQGRPSDYRFEQINPAFAGLTGLPLDAVGKTARQLVPDLEPYWPQVYGQVALSGTAVRFEHAAPSMGRSFDVHASRVGGADSRRVAILFNDITQRKRAEAELRRAAALDAYRVELSDALRRLSDAVEIQAAASRVLGQHLRANRALYFEVGSDDYLIARDHADGVPSLAGRYPIAAFSVGLHAAYVSGRTVTRVDIAADSSLSAAERAAYAAIQIGAHIGVPLIKGGAFVAGLAVHSMAPRAWTDDEVMLVEETAEQTWAAVERARAEEALRQADRRKDEFLATLAHELRNPLAAIAAGLAILERQAPAAGPQERVVGMLQRQTRNLAHLIDDLMDVSRIASGKVVLRREVIDLAAVLQSAVEVSRPLITAGGHDLRIDPPAERIWVDADPTRLAQVFANLLNNAAKYSENGGQVVVTTRLSGGVVEVSVRDRGIGIAAELLPQVFEPFVQASQAVARVQGGLGIGLALVRSLVALHGGSVRALSAGLGQGSEFVVTLPVAAPPTEAAAGSPSVALGEAVDADGRAPVDSPVSRRILVADDNQDAAHALAELLRMQGHEVTVVHDGAAAVEAAERVRPDVVLLDIGMPQLSGRGACRQIRRQHWAAGIRIVALTGWGQADDRRQSEEAGFDLHLVKPVDPAALAGLLQGRWPPPAPTATIAGTQPEHP